MKPNTGTLGKNDRKTKETHPDSSGSMNVVCQHCHKTNDYWISGWTKESARGRFSSLAFKDKEVAQQGERTVAKPEFDDELPF
jgi:hypothetical protein